MSEKIDQVEEVIGDKIDDALSGLLDEVLGSDPSDEAIEYISSLMFSVIEDMEDAEEIDPMPDEGSTEDEQAEWLETEFPKLKAKMIEASLEQ